MVTGSSRSPTCGATCRRRSAFPAIIPCVPCERWSRRSCGTSRPSSISSPPKPGRPSIPPGHLLRALLLQVLYSVRSERLRMEQLDYNWRANSFRRRPLTNQLDDPLSELRRVRRWLFGIVDLPFCRNDGVSTKRGATPHVIPVRFSTLTAIDPLNVRAPLSAKTPFAVITKVRAPLICP